MICLCILVDTPDHQSFCSMSMHLYGKKMNETKAKIQIEKKLDKSNENSVCGSRQFPYSRARMR